MTTPTAAPPAQRIPPGHGSAGFSRWNALRVQFMGVVFALTFFPNAALVLLVSQGQISRPLVLWVVLVGLLCALLGYYLSGLMLKPLLRLRSEAERGTFGTQMSDDPLEVRDLRHAFAGLLERLEVEQRRRHAFMATLVHDLKTPLIATGHLTALLLGEGLSQAERKDVGEQMLSENGRLLRLVQQMADAHRFEREDLTLSVQPLDAGELLRGVAQRLSTRAAAQGLSLQVVGEARVWGDAAALERALGNLCENALRYARSCIELRVETRAQEVLLSVADDGPGLSAPLEELAQPFNAQPVAIAGQQYTAGTAGLGLFIARRVAEAHGGTLSATAAPHHLSSDKLSPNTISWTVLSLHLPATKARAGQQASRGGA